MDHGTRWLVVLLVLLVVGVVMLRRRYGNIYAALTRVIERATGLPMATIVRGLGVVTLIGWAVVYLFFGGEGENDLGQLFRKAFRGSGADEVGQ